ncbi:MAG: thioredoxin [Bacteroidia bacterium]|jgi:thioredoxin 1
MAHTITTGNFEELVKNSGKVALVDFWAAWCGPCRMVGPVVEEIANEMGDTAVIGKVDVDAEGDLAMEFGIRNIPTLLFFKDGQVVDKHVGVATKKQLQDKLAALM